MSRFSLQWLVPGQADQMIHVMLLDKDRPAPYALAAGHGANRAQALLNLWGTLKKSNEAAEAIDYVAGEYSHRAGQAPAETTG